MPKLSEHFGSLYELSRHASRASSTFPIMFEFCAIAIGADEEKLRTLPAFTFSDSFLNIDPPPSVFRYTLGEGSSPFEQLIAQAINQHVIRYEMPSDDPSVTEIEEFEKKESKQNAQKGRLCTKIESI